MLFGIVVMGNMTSCNDFLDREPVSAISPEKYLWNDAQLSAYAMDNYQILPTHPSDNDHKYSWGTFARDENTDIMAAPSMDNKFIPGQWKVPNREGEWSFSRIQQLNYFIETVIPRYEAGELGGNISNCKHYIGEIYFFRAFEYFSKLRALGDFPIITKNYPDDMDQLIAASKRAPRNEVARFILSDLDNAISFLNEKSPDGNKNRLNKACAYLLKSRVALYEGTWEKYFKGTAFVPGGEGWPGASKDYNQGKTFNLDAEIQFFLDEAMKSAKSVADAVDLESNTWKEGDATQEKNRYFTMFGDLDMSKYGEVLLWRQYDQGLGITHNVNVYATAGNQLRGVTRSFVESFLMKDGLPIYKSTDYQGDDYIADLKKKRDPRLQIFLKEPGQTNAINNLTTGTHGNKVEPKPDILNTDGERKYNTGYAISKGMNYDYGQNRNGASANGSIVFRAAEAYLNYIEACYEKTGTIDGTAESYWKKIRDRAGVDVDFQKTIRNTDMSKEKLNWASYSAGAQVNTTLFNIRRERSSELFAEGLREQDLKRWRAMDQLINEPYHFDGFKLWGPMKSWYTLRPTDYSGGPLSKVSAPDRSDYLRPYERTTVNNLAYDGAKWCMAHYLNPIATEHFLVATIGNGLQESEQVDYSKSPIYQNPGWKIDADSTPEVY
ncbi:MAG: RagB/SusD family nutrient uptake outer membrane protein [Dysgonamonadaceae bacterium]|nr:RagB/SusD family nutrient uptake outer membrane protein [Dysgonamonadaceae bacterium]